MQQLWVGERETSVRNAKCSNLYGFINLHGGYLFLFSLCVFVCTCVTFYLPSIHNFQSK